MFKGNWTAKLTHADGGEFRPEGGALARGVDEEVAAAASFAAWDGFCVELLEALTSER